ncbi:hypothetical protein NMY22_g825 [Coprinellus aureogranulatus]|nr:hypothetical protein NMY22_g825 [Coprinellus aureogranulatus]
MFEPIKVVSRILANLFLVAFFLMINKQLWTFVLKLFGQEIHIRSISLFPFTLPGITYHYHLPAFTLDGRVESIQCSLHLPRPSNPKLITITVEDTFYKKSNLYATKSDKITVVVWVLLVFFRQTSSSFITVKVYEGAVDNINAEEEAWWARAIRANIEDAVLQGETIRLT